MFWCKSNFFEESEAVENRRRKGPDTGNFPIFPCLFSILQSSSQFTTDSCTRSCSGEHGEESCQEFGQDTVQSQSIPENGNNVMENMSNKPDDIAGSPLQAPVQPSNIVFPVTSFSGKGRSFNPAWFSSYKWMEYSVKCDACFCYPCRLFGSGGGPASRPVQVFTVTGFKSWKHATGKHGSLAVHDACSSHRQAVIAWDLYMHTQETGVTVADQLGTARAQLVKKNRHLIKMIAKILLLCARQDIALRGHRESADSSNRGNFLEILTLATELDGTIDLSASPQNALYIT